MRIIAALVAIICLDFADEMLYDGRGTVVAANNVQVGDRTTLIHWKLRFV